MPFMLPNQSCQTTKAAIHQKCLNLYTYPQNQKGMQQSAHLYKGKSIPSPWPANTDHNSNPAYHPHYS